MGVNMAGNSIIDDEVCCEASCQEIIRRYYKTACAVRQGRATPAEVQKIELLMRQLNLDSSRRSTVRPALALAEQTGEPAVAMELNDGTIITGKTSALLGAASAALLNALKALAGIPDEIKLISPNVIEPIQHLKVAHMGNRNPLLHIDEILIALTICAVTDDNAEQAMEQLSKLNGCEVHSSVILSQADEGMLSKLGMNVTCEPAYQTNKLYHK
jgi:uncharacterized protein (UPF0371 family)